MTLLRIVGQIKAGLFLNQNFFLKTGIFLGSSAGRFATFDGLPEALFDLAQADIIDTLLG